MTYYRTYSGRAGRTTRAAIYKNWDAPTPAAPPSDKQVKFIDSLMQQHGTEGVPQDLLDDFMTAALTRTQASRLIDALKAAPKLQVTPAAAPVPVSSPLAELPVSKYAVEDTDGVLLFFEVVERRGGRKFLNRLIGSPGDWRRDFMPARDVAFWATLITTTGSTCCAQRYSAEFTRCAACEAPLSDEDSRAVGFGPVCRKRYGL